jgi:hypothetical protein
MHQSHSKMSILSSCWALSLAGPAWSEPTCLPRTATFSSNRFRATHPPVPVGSSAATAFSLLLTRIMRLGHRAVCSTKLLRATSRSEPCRPCIAEPRAAPTLMRPDLHRRLLSSVTRPTPTHGCAPNARLRSPRATSQLSPASMPTVLSPRCVPRATGAGLQPSMRVAHFAGCDAAVTPPNSAAAQPRIVHRDRMCCLEQIAMRLGVPASKVEQEGCPALVLRAATARPTNAVQHNV